MKHICGETTHVATNGSGGSKLVKYIACKKFVEMNPGKRFNKFRKRGFVFNVSFLEQNEVRENLKITSVNEMLHIKMRHLIPTILRNMVLSTVNIMRIKIAKIYPNYTK